MTDKTDGRRGIQSVEIGMRVLSALSMMTGPSTLSSIAQQAGLSLSQTHRYLASLIVSGLVVQEGRSGLYDLGPQAVRIGLAALARLDVFGSAEEQMRAVVLETRRTCLISVMGDDGPTVVRLFPGSPPLLVSLGVGSRLPLLRSATGQIFFTFGDRTEMDRQVNLARARDPDSVPAGLDDTRRQIEARGYAQVSGDVIPGLRAIAAPIFDLQGNLSLVAVLLAGEYMPGPDDEEVAAALVRACGRATEAVGGTRSGGTIAEPAPTSVAKGKRGAAASRPRRTTARD